MANHRAGRRSRRTPEPGATPALPGSHRRASIEDRRRYLPAEASGKHLAALEAAPEAPDAPEAPAARRSGGARRSVPETARSAGGARKAVPEAARSTGGARKAVPEAVRSTGGARKAHAGARKKLLPALPGVPTLAGAAVVALAATGALTLGHPSLGELGAGGLTQLSAHANLSLGGSASGDQTRPSRDAARPGFLEPQDQQLVAAADAQAKERTDTLAALAASAQRHADALAWHLPVAPGRYELTARFGEVSGLWAHVHTGLDFAGPIGTPIMAVAGGVITSTGWGGAYGNRTVETLPDGTELWYCHQNEFNVQPGQHVAPGQVIGYIGATGNVTGPHLHLEVRPGGGAPVDPYTALLEHGVHP